MSGTRVLSRKRGCLVAALLLVALFPGCSQSIKDVVISEETEAGIAQQLPTELTVEEARLLHGYLERTYPELEEGRLPAGRTLGGMIADQRALEGPAPENETEAGKNAETPARAGSVQGEDTAPKAVVEPPPPPPLPVTATLPSGSKLQVRLRAAISSKSNRTGDRFEAALDHDLAVDGQLLAPAGSRVVGTLTEIKKSGKVKGRARMSLTLNEIHAADATYEVRDQHADF